MPSSGQDKSPAPDRPRSSCTDVRDARAQPEVPISSARRSRNRERMVQRFISRPRFLRRTISRMQERGADQPGHEGRSRPASQNHQPPSVPSLVICHQLPLRYAERGAPTTTPLRSGRRRHGCGRAALGKGGQANNKQHIKMVLRSNHTAGGLLSSASTAPEKE